MWFNPTARGLTASGRPAAVIVNCTGMGSVTLGGVKDESVVPARGQVVLVRNKTSDRIVFLSGAGPNAAPHETTYIMMRAAGGGTILGGCYQKGRHDAVPDTELTKRIMQRSIEICPELVPPGAGVEALDVIRVGVGLRPVREKGPRVESEQVLDGLAIVHNYGHGGAGYQCSYGCAMKVQSLVSDALAPASKL